ncbi:roundabout homolog 1 [Trichonephila clavata]|uniref:Roundabout homolog 1 n=1 Tax=Trichonephila clavata TaxID=2740835 RepID=A0A8X6GMX2_TRICU|nr:roundabout homolog 1 [Trichonephila clavata]
MLCFTLTVPPQWISAPNDANSFSGEYLVINCKASGKPVPTISWMKSEGKGIDGYVAISESEMHRLPLNGSLVIESVRKSDEGIYQCLAANSVGQSLKKIISINVFDDIFNFDKSNLSMGWTTCNTDESEMSTVPYFSKTTMKYFVGVFLVTSLNLITTASVVYPKIQPFNFPSNVIVGQKASATCTAISGDQPLEFKWLKNGKDIPTGGEVTIRTLVDVSVLVIETVDASSTGNYTCYLRTSSGSDTFTAPLEVKEPSRWINNIQDQDLKAEDNVTILCKSDGIPLPKVIWKKKTDSALEVVTSVEEQQQSPGASKLLLINTKPENNGYYECEAHNNVGNPISRIINIKVLGKERHL